MADNIPNAPAGAQPPKPPEPPKVQPKKETVRISLPAKPTTAPTIKIPTPAGVAAPAQRPASPAGAPPAPPGPVPPPPPPAAARPAAVGAPAPVAAPAAAAPARPAVSSRPAASGASHWRTLWRLPRLCLAHWRWPEYCSLVDCSNSVERVSRFERGLLGGSTTALANGGER